MLGVPFRLPNFASRFENDHCLGAILLVPQTIAYVPRLGIEVVTSNAEELDRLIAEHIRAALLRNDVIGALRNLIWLQRTEAVHVEVVSHLAEIDTCWGS